MHSYRSTTRGKRVELLGEKKEEVTGRERGKKPGVEGGWGKGNGRRKTRGDISFRATPAFAAHPPPSASVFDLFSFHIPRGQLLPYECQRKLFVFLASYTVAAYFFLRESRCGRTSRRHAFSHLYLKRAVGPWVVVLDAIMVGANILSLFHKFVK